MSRSNESINAGICLVPTCDRPAQSRRMCQRCYNKSLSFVHATEGMTWERFLEQRLYTTVDYNSGKSCRRCLSTNARLVEITVKHTRTKSGPRSTKRGFETFLCQDCFKDLDVSIKAWHEKFLTEGD